MRQVKTHIMEILYMCPKIGYLEAEYSHRENKHRSLWLHYPRLH